ncbi:pyridoxamine 5'-phosphate oxidase family protein [Micromonospora sp. LOL_023]|uniref:pyridoxamine 5'-phosphate oxidase family protein n=1 Tax=Micromonospora sp. LOL_023 TaxID=3345418 RepID=UPI003A83C111
MATTDPHAPSAALRDFWRERHLCSLTTLRGDGSPHVVPVGVTFDPDDGTALVITSGRSRKAVHVRTSGAAGARVAVSTGDGGRRSRARHGSATIRRRSATPRHATPSATGRHARTRTGWSS